MFCISLRHVGGLRASEERPDRVEGVGETPGAAQDPEAEFAQMYPSFHQGENLVGARKAPVLLNDPSRLVYMPHSYGPGVRSLPYMEIEDFPENTEQVWEEHFLFLRKRAEARQRSRLTRAIEMLDRAPMATERYAAGDTLFRQGEAATHFYILKSGQLASSFVSSTGETAEQLAKRAMDMIRRHEQRQEEIEKSF